MEKIYAKDSEYHHYIDGVGIGYSRKINLLEKTLSGDKIWEYGYKG